MKVILRLLHAIRAPSALALALAHHGGVATFHPGQSGEGTGQTTKGVPVDLPKNDHF